MKVSDYIVEFFAEKEIFDFFGYQGTMIAHLVDSIGKNEKVKNHVCYNEQGAAFAACGYAASMDKCAVAYATSGPGALNLVSGIANAYYDAIPIVFITGQINTYERHDEIEKLRQSSFQETKTVEICKPITKFAEEIRNPEKIPEILEKAYHLATTDRRGPVLLDIPMNVQRAEINVETKKSKKYFCETENMLDILKDELDRARRPVLLLGNGIQRKDRNIFIQFAEKLEIPVVTSLMAKDMLPYEHKLNFGYIGSAYGHRYANLIVAGKSDLIISIGCSLCTRQTGTKVEQFAPDAKVIRFDIDSAELQRKVKDDEISFLLDTSELAKIIEKEHDKWMEWPVCSSKWLDFCDRYKKFCEEFDQTVTYSQPNRIVAEFNKWLHSDEIVVCDVGQHMMWVAQSMQMKENTVMLFSGAHGAMGYALPAAIGAAIANKGKTIYCFSGDGAMQMNIQELQWLKNEDLDVVVIVMNNHSLGLITQQQEAYFDSKFCGATAPEFCAPDFTKIAQSYEIDAVKVREIEEIDKVLSERKKGHPFLLEVILDDFTKAYPKTILGEKIYNQEPALPQDLLINYLKEDI